MTLETARSARRAELLDAADRVIRAEGPEASMTAIAAEAGITKPILYRHFGDKRGLYQALAQRYVKPILTAVRQTLTGPGDPRSRTVDTINAYLVFIETYPEVYRFLMHRATVEEPEAHSAVSEFIHQIGDEIAASLRQDFAFTPEQEEAVDAWGHALVGMVQVAGDWWLTDRSMPRERFADHLVALLWEGLGNLRRRVS